MGVITIVGSGMMGSALAFPARENGNEVRLFVRLQASMISLSRCVPTKRTSLPFSLAGKARADPIMPAPTIVMTAISFPR